MMFAKVCQFSAPIVLIAWAIVGASSAETQTITALFRVLFSVTLALHIRQEWNGRRQRKAKF